jgi:hypothetical protein
MKCIISTPHRSGDNCGERGISHASLSTVPVRVLRAPSLVYVGGQKSRNYLEWR